MKKLHCLKTFTGAINMPKYLYRCATCKEQVEIDHTIEECSIARLCPFCEKEEITRVIMPVKLVGPRVKPGSKEVKAQQEHEQLRNIRRKRGEPS